MTRRAGARPPAPPPAGAPPPPRARPAARRAAAALAAAHAAGPPAACAPRPARDGAPAPARRPAAASPSGGSSVPADEIAAFRGTRVEDLIQGRVPGVQVTRTGDGDYAVRIRGANSVLGSGTPLYVIDGTQVRAQGLLSALAGVQPQLVERIEVLKDAGATSIYGVLGANGVILITTKRARR